MAEEEKRTHLSKDELELLSKREFRGKGLFDALKHIESCQVCRSQIKLPTTEEILKGFDLDSERNIKTASKKPPAK